jgi:predicted DNA binding protein
LILLVDPRGFFYRSLAAGFSSVRKVYMTTETLGRIEIPTLAMPVSALTDRQREGLEALPCRVTELSRKLGVSKLRASRLLKNLMKKCLVYKNEDKKNLLSSRLQAKYC